MFAVSGNANAPAGLTGPAGAFTMTQPKQFHGRAYLEGSIASHSRRSISVSEKTWVTPEVRRYKPRRRVSNRGSNNCSTHNVPLPRGPVNAPIPRNGVGRQARVDPRGDLGAYTAGPTRTPQRGCARKAPTGRVSMGWTAAAGRSGRVRAADVSRPGAAVMGRAASSDRPTDRREHTSPPLLSGLSPRSRPQNGQQGRGASLPHSHREVTQCPYYARN